MTELDRLRAARDAHEANPPCLRIEDSFYVLYVCSHITHTLIQTIKTQNRVTALTLLEERTASHERAKLIYQQAVDAQEKVT